MGLITFNLTTSARVRRVTINGREFLVAPMTLIVPGVLAGSRGPLLYPPAEIRNNFRQWNGVPLVLYHPTDPVTNHPQSADEDGVWERSGLGRVRNAHVDQKGRLRAEGWFDAERTHKLAPAVYNSLINHKSIELSTGLFTDNEPARGTHNGRRYEYIARNYRADHLAVLPDQVGACSLDDGCGVVVANSLSWKSVRNQLFPTQNPKPRPKPIGKPPCPPGGT